MVVDKSHPALGWNRAPLVATKLSDKYFRNVRGDTRNSQLQEQLDRNAGLFPGRLVTGHAQSQTLRANHSMVALRLGRRVRRCELLSVTVLIH